MKTKKVSVLIFYTLNLVQRVAVSILIGLNPFANENQMLTLWLFVILVCLSPIFFTFRPPFKSIENNVSYYATSLFTTYVSLVLYALMDQKKRTKTRESQAKWFITVYTCILGVLTLFQIVICLKNII